MFDWQSFAPSNMHTHTSLFDDLAHTVHPGRDRRVALGQQRSLGVERRPLHTFGHVVHRVQRLGGNDRGLGRRAEHQRTLSLRFGEHGPGNFGAGNTTLYAVARCELVVQH